MIKPGRMNLLRLVLFFGMAVFACAAAGAESGGGRTVLFDMGSLIDTDPYDAAALEERFAASRGGSAGNGKDETDLSAPAAGYALARALSLSGRSAEARGTLEKTEAMLRKKSGTEAVRSVLAAHVYLELIVDGPSWMRFKADLESAMKTMEAAGAPRRDIVYVEAKRLALFPPEIGGDIGRSLELFASIDAEAVPFEFAARYARAAISAGKRDDARSLLEKRVSMEGRDAAAAALLERLRVEDSGAAVGSVILPEGLRTAEDRIAGAIRLRAGARLSAEAVAEDLRRLAELPGISFADVRYRYDGTANEAQVEYLVREEKSRSLSFFMAGKLNAGPHESGYLYPDEKVFNAAVVYGDSNLFGRAWNFNLITAGVYNMVELSKERLAGMPFDVSLEAEGLLLSAEELFFYDEHRYLEDKSALTSKYLRGGITAGFPMPLGGRLSASYGLRRDWYTREEDTPDTFVLPADLLHTARLGFELDMQGRSGPAGIIPIGFRFGTEVEYDYYQDFRDWGSPDFWNTAPDNDRGTLKYGAETRYGTLFLERFNAGVALGAYGGSNYYTRTYHRLGGSAGPMSTSLLFLRGYRDDEFTAKRAWVGHLDAGYELSPGKVHLGLFSDIAAVLPAIVATGEWRTVYSAGFSFAAVLPWEINLYAEFGHGFTDLTGSIDHGHDALSLILIRSFSW